MIIDDEERDDEFDDPFEFFATVCINDAPELRSRHVIDTLAKLAGKSRRDARIITRQIQRKGCSPVVLTDAGNASRLEGALLAAGIPAVTCECCE